ncbi:MAG: DUF892 family protein [Acidobacteriota bacterium]|nr:DUF892 family protein [Acidobacteriota bacterium]
MAIKTLEQLFIHELGDIYDAEHQFLEAQQKMHKQASSKTIVTMLEKHIGETEQQIKNLEQVFKALGEKAERVKCQGAAGLVSEGTKMLKETAENQELADFAMLGAMAKVENYEIPAYEGLITGAEKMKQKEVVRLLKENLKQEQQTAQKVAATLPQILEKAMSSEKSSSASA